MNIYLICTVDEKDLMTIQKAFLSKKQATIWMERSKPVYKIINKVELIMIDQEIEDWHGMTRQAKNGV